MIILKLSKLLNSKEGRFIISALLGFGFATVFRASCQGSNCVVRVAPPYKKLTQPFKIGDKCYSFTHKNVKCKGSAVNFE